MSKEEDIVKAVTDALGKESKFFIIEKGEILNEDDEYFSMSVTIEPNKEPFGQYAVKPKEGRTHLEVSQIDDEYWLMVGEDGDIELDITYGNLYAQLYWSEVLEEI